MAITCPPACHPGNFLMQTMNPTNSDLTIVHFLHPVVDVSAQSCTVTPQNPTTLTAAGGALPNGTMNVMIQCNCTNDYGTVVGVVRWYDPDGTRLVADTNYQFDANTPHFTRVDGSNTHVILVIPTFTDYYDGTYKCGNRQGESDGLPGSPNVDVILTIEGVSNPYSIYCISMVANYIIT